MQLKKILLVFGTRPEAIKMAPLVHSLRKRPGTFKVSVCVTGQHREMLDQILKLFEIKPDFDLNIMRHGQDLSSLTAIMLKELKKVLETSKPDIVLVHGDTTTALSAALASFYYGIKVAHVEAGLRTYDRNSPFPEEINRQLVSKLSTWHFAPTQRNNDNLVKELISSEQIMVTGNTVIDALLSMDKLIASSTENKKQIYQNLERILNFDIRNFKYILVTGHRRENFGEGLIEICDALKILCLNYPTLKFVFPVHLNPHVQRSVYKHLNGVPNCHLISPLEYDLFLFLMKHCFCVLTDSGGIQEEAPTFKKPVLVTRDVTERQEGVVAGAIKLVGSKRENVILNISRLIEDPFAYEKMSQAVNPYGDGMASLRITDFLAALKV